MKQTTEQLASVQDIQLFILFFLFLFLFLFCSLRMLFFFVVFFFTSVDLSTCPPPATDLLTASNDLHRRFFSFDIDNPISVGVVMRRRAVENKKINHIAPYPLSPPLFLNLSVKRNIDDAN